MKLDDHEPEVVEQTLRYLYSGAYDNRIASTAPDSTPHDAIAQEDSTGQNSLPLNGTNLDSRPPKDTLDDLEDPASTPREYR